MRKFILLAILFLTAILQASPLSVALLKDEISGAEKNKNYEHCINMLTAFLADNEVSAADKYEAYILKANIYKALFKYEHALYFLEAALTEGLKGSNQFAVRQRITAERALIYFDKQDFAQSLKLMEKLAETNYKSLDKKYLLFLYTQKGYFLVKEKHYQSAEDYLNKALHIGLRNFPAELPIVYGKQIELYHLTDAFEKRDLAYRNGIENARKAGNIKYEFYLEEIMKNVFSSTADYKNAFHHQKKCDSLFALYNSDIKSSKLELLEKRLAEDQYKIDLRNRKLFFILLILFSAILLLLLFLLFKLYTHVKKKNLLIEEDNKQIREKIKHLENSKVQGSD